MQNDIAPRIDPVLPPDWTPAVLDAVLAEDPDARVACETSTTTGLVVVFGEITTSTYVDVQALVRQVVLMHQGRVTAHSAGPGLKSRCAG